MKTFACILAAALFVLSCAHAPLMPTGMISGDSMPANLYCVDAKCTIYRSAQPNAVQFAAMVETLHLRSVIKLNLALEGRDVLPDSVEPYENPWAMLGPVTHEQVEEALIDLDHAERPVLIHCTHGEDRTGLFVALYRVKREHALPAAAWGEWRAYGKNVAWDKLFDEAFTRETGYRP